MGLALCASGTLRKQSINTEEIYFKKGKGQSWKENVLKMFH